MQKVKLGTTDVEVSVLCLGTMYMGTKTPADISYTLLDRYIEAGGTFLDTANCYAAWYEGGFGGESERLLGHWLKERGCRDKVQIASKVGFGYTGTEEDPGAETSLRAEIIIRECEKSLKRLGIDCLDLFYAHNDAGMLPLDEMLGAFDKLIREGKTRAIGASNFTSWRLADALSTSAHQQLAQFCCVQQNHTYLRPVPGFRPELWPPASPEFLDQCARKDITVIAYSPLVRGAYMHPDQPLTAKFAGPDSAARLKVLGQVAQTRGVSANQIVLAWLLHSNPQVLPLFGCSSIEQINDTFKCLKIKLTADEMTLLNDAGCVKR